MSRLPRTQVISKLVSNAKLNFLHEFTVIYNTSMIINKMSNELLLLIALSAERAFVRKRTNTILPRVAVLLKTLYPQLHPHLPTSRDRQGSCLILLARSLIVARAVSRSERVL